MLALRRARRCVTAWVRRSPYERDGVIVRGQWHFAPAAKVYVEPPFSGDGWERAYMVGRHRETGAWARVIGPRNRLRGFYVEEVTDPIARDLLRDCASWEDDPRTRSWMEQIDARAKAPRERPWTDEEWGRVVDRVWTPERASLVTNAAKVMGCDEADVVRWASDATLGARLHAIERGRWTPTVRDPERSARTAWEHLAPDAWIDDPTRRFAAIGNEDDPEARTAAPSGLPAVVAFSSDVAGVTAAEELSREIARALGAALPREFVWHIGTLAAMQGYLERVGRSATGATSLTDTVPAVFRALLRDDDELAAEIAREAPSAVGLAWRACFELASRGYAVVALSGNRAELAAVDLPRARVRGDAW